MYLIEFELFMSASSICGTCNVPGGNCIDSGLCGSGNTMTILNMLSFSTRKQSYYHKSSVFKPDGSLFVLEFSSDKLLLMKSAGFGASVVTYADILHRIGVYGSAQKGGI